MFGKKKSTAAPKHAPAPLVATVLGVAVATPAATTSGTTQDKVTQDRGSFVPPDEVTARHYAPQSLDERRLLEEAVAATMKAYAAYFLGYAPEPRADDVFVASPYGLARMLTEDAHDRRPRDGKLVTAGMIAYAWHKRLSDDERRVLATFCSEWCAGRNPFAALTRQGALAL